MEADNPLLRAGLARLARRSRLEVVDDVKDASVTITDGELQTALTPLAVSVETSGVLVWTTSPPTDEEWSMLRRLVEDLLG